MRWSKCWMRPSRNKKRRASGRSAHPADVRQCPEREYQATSNSAAGFLWAIRSNVRAAPEGIRRPCSQSCNVRTDTPSNAANRDWDNPVLWRTSETAGTFTTRPDLPRLSSRIPFRISAPMSLSLFIFYFLADLLQHVTWKHENNLVSTKLNIGNYTALPYAFKNTDLVRKSTLGLITKKYRRWFCRECQFTGTHSLWFVRLHDSDCDLLPQTTGVQGI